MWFRSRKPAPIRSLVGEGTVLRGGLTFVDGLRIDGEVHGDVTAAGAGSLLVVGEKARICGKVKAGHVIINGAVSGPVQADELLELQPKARVVGEVSYTLLEMHQGATVDGELRPLKSEDRPPLKLAASNPA